MSNKEYIRDPSLESLLRKFKSEDYFIIPAYQRSYAWNKDRVISFWDELLIPDNKSEYNLSFSGSIILKNNKDKDPKNSYEIIDGQQRFITISILIALIRDYSKFLLKTKYKKNDKLSEQFNRIFQKTQDMLKIEDGWTGDGKPRINVGRVIKDYYDKIIVESYDYEKNMKKPFSSLDNDSQRNILRNYKTFSTKLIEYINIKSDNENEEYKVIINILDSLDEIEVIEIPVTDDVAAYEIFETVNSKNEPLTSSDLIKNQILRNLDQNPKYEEIWNKSIENISQVDGFAFNQFLRYYWISKYGWTTDKKLYANFKFHLNSINKKKSFLKAFLDEILINSIHFRRLLNPEFDDFINLNFADSQKNDKKIIKSLKTIKALNVKQCYVLLLSLFRNSVKVKTKLNDRKKFSSIPRAVAIMIKNIEVFSLRFHILAKGQANKVEKSIYHLFAIEIEKLNSKELSDSKIIKNWTSILKDSLVLKLENLIDEENIDYASSLGKLDYSKLNIDYYVINYTFEKINQFNYRQKHFSFNDNSTVEHILPKKPSKWKLKANEIEDYVNKIGNLIIIEKKLNRDLSNETLEKKINGIEKNNGEIISYFDDKCNYNLELFKKIKRDLNKKEFSNNGTKYWDRVRIINRIKTISVELNDSLDKYLED